MKKLAWKEDYLHYKKGEEFVVTDEAAQPYLDAGKAELVEEGATTSYAPGSEPVSDQKPASLGQDNVVIEMSQQPEAETAEVPKATKKKSE